MTVLARDPMEGAGGANGWQNIQFVCCSAGGVARQQ